MKTIDINIWDDYWDDGHVPLGQKQETYIYIEENDISLYYGKSCLEYLLGFINLNVAIPGTKFYIQLFDPLEKYPKLAGTDNENLFSKRWEIRIENLTHVRREELVEYLQSANLSFKGVPLNIYSSS
jgi:hypothetical protein